MINQGTGNKYNIIVTSHGLNITDGYDGFNKIISIQHNTMYIIFIMNKIKLMTNDKTTTFCPVSFGS